MILTSDPTLFGEQLTPGDVVVFDSLSAVSGLIQWADNAPANHVCLMLDEKTAIQANLSEGGAAASAVERVPIVGLTALARVRGAVALRHQQLSDDPAALARVLSRAADYERVASHFSVADLSLLCPAALLRSYDEPGMDPLPEGWSRDLLLAALHLAARETLRRMPDDARSLVCSEFVFRCFVESGIRIDIANPLGLSPTSGEQQPWAEEAISAEAELWRELRARNASVDVPELGPGLGQQAVSTDVQPDRVTPGDLWRSASLRPVVQLAKPPRPAS